MLPSLICSTPSISMEICSGCIAPGLISSAMSGPTSSRCVRANGRFWNSPISIRVRSCSTPTRASSPSWDGVESSWSSPPMSKLDLPLPPDTQAPPFAPPADSRSPGRRVPLWFKGLAPLLLLAGLVALFLRVGPLGVFRQNFPPVEELTIERIRLPQFGVMEVEVVNGGPEPVTVAQVMVEDANWVHSISGSRTLERLESPIITIPYPWVEGEPHTVALVTSTGLTFTGDVAVSTLSPQAESRYLTPFSLLGVFGG